MPAQRCQWTFCGYEFAPSQQGNDKVKKGDPFLNLLLESTPRLFITPAVMGICAAIFIIMVATRVSIINPTAENLLHWGANFSPMTASGQWWRLLSSMFVHFGIAHLLVNMWCLWNIGQLTERLYGSASFGLIYLISGIGGNIISSYLNPLSVGAGPSGAIFGLVGASLAFFIIQKLRVAKSTLLNILKSVLVFLGWNIFFGFTHPGIHNAAHIGGLCVGFGFGLFMTRPLPAPEAPDLTQRIKVTGIALVLLTLGALGIKIRTM